MGREREWGKEWSGKDRGSQVDRQVPELPKGMFPMIQTGPKNSY